MPNTSKLAPPLSVPLFDLQSAHISKAVSDCSHRHLNIATRIIIIVIIIIIIIIAFKGAIRDFFFFFFLQSPHSAANCLQHARSSGPGAIVCKSLATH